MKHTINIQRILSQIVYASLLWQCSALLSCMLVGQLLASGLIHLIAQEDPALISPTQSSNNDQTAISTAVFDSEQAAWSAVSALLTTVPSESKANGEPLRWCTLTSSDSVWVSCVGGRPSTLRPATQSVHWQLLSRQDEPKQISVNASDVSSTTSSGQPDIKPNDSPIRNNWIERSNGKRITYDDATDHWIR